MFNWNTVHESDEWIYQEHNKSGLRRAKAKLKHFTVRPDNKWLTRGGAAKSVLGMNLFQTIYYGTCRPIDHERIDIE